MKRTYNDPFSAPLNVSEIFNKEISTNSSSVDRINHIATNNLVFSARDRSEQVEEIAKRYVKGNIDSELNDLMGRLVQTQFEETKRRRLNDGSASSSSDTPVDIFVEVANMLYSQLGDVENVKRIFNGLKTISDDQDLKEILALAKILISYFRSTNKSIKNDIFDLLIQSKDKIKEINFLIGTKRNNPEYILDILKFAPSVTQEQMKNAAESTAIVISNIRNMNPSAYSSLNNKLEIFKVFVPIQSKERREALVKDANIFFRGFYRQLSKEIDHVDSFLSVLARLNFPVEELTDNVLYFVQFYFIKDQKDLSEIMKHLNNIPDKVLHHNVILLLMNWEVPRLPSKLIGPFIDDAVAFLQSANGRTYNPQEIRPLLHYSKTKEDFQQIFKIISEFPEESYEKVISSIYRLSYGTNSREEMINLIDFVVKIYNEKHEDILDKIGKFQNLTTKRVLEILKLFFKNEDECIELLNLPLQLEINQGSLSLIEYFRDLFPLNREERVHVSNCILKLTNGEMDRDRLVRLKLLIPLKKEEREEIVQLLLERRRSGQNVPRTVDFIKIMLMIPQQQRKEASGFIRECVYFPFISYFPIEDLVPILKICGSQEGNPVGEPSTIIALLKSKDPALLEKVYRNISAMLSNETDRLKAAKISSDLRSILNDLLLDEDHPLYIQILSVYFGTNRSIDRTNPYDLHQHLVLTTSQEPLISIKNGPSVDGTKINFDFLRETSQTKILTIEDLPKINKNLIWDLFKGLTIEIEVEVEGKIVKKNGLRPGVAKALFLNGSIESQFEMFNNIKNYLIGSKSIVPVLLDKDPKVVGISSEIFYLYSIINAISQASSELREESALTLQEEMLLNFAQAMLNCHTAQTDALSLFYNHLPAQLRMVVKTGKETYRLMVESFIDTCVQGKLRSLLTEETLLLVHLLGNIPSQYVHSTNYLVNRLCKQIGLRHKIVFDLHSECIDYRLFKMSLEELLDKVVNFLQPNLFIDNIRLSFQDLLQNKPILVQPILELIQTRFPSVSGEVVFEPVVGDQAYRFIINRMIEKHHLQLRNNLDDLDRGSLEEVLDDLISHHKSIEQDTEYRNFKTKVDAQEVKLTKEGAKLVLLASGYLTPA